MISSYQTNENRIICVNYQNALGTLKEKLYNGDYNTSTHSSVCIAYNRRIHRYQVFSSQDNSIPINENPRSKENYDTIRILDIPTSSDEFNKCIESQRELVKLNNNLSESMTGYNKEEELASDIRKHYPDFRGSVISAKKDRLELRHTSYQFWSYILCFHTMNSYSMFSTISHNSFFGFSIDDIIAIKACFSTI